MSSQLIRSGECRKFSPNIFNKTKCTNCFRQKEEHSAEALESNRASRKIAKCGYLFVAPGWDFTNPINRTKRWQRRWFVLYDDGELSYSLDEHPETVPQASIDMNKVVEVTGAEELTGNPYSLAITAPDVVHFVKGTSREEARFWTDVLSVFPRSKGRHKRNATFPGTQPSTKSTHILQTPPIRDTTPLSSSESEVVTSRNQYNSRLSSQQQVWDGDDVFPTKEVVGPPSPQQNSSTLIQSTNSTDVRKVYMGSPPTRDKIEKLDEKVRSRRVVNREKRGLKTGRSYSEDISKMVPSLWQHEKTSPTEDRVSRLGLVDSYHQTEIKLKDLTDSISRPRSSVVQHCIEPTRDSDYTSHKQIRGDPDGCGLDPSLSRRSPSDLRVDLPTEDLLNIKRGWLMKQGQDKDWTKHWFVLRGSGLLYYRDPKAEDQSVLDGVIDLSGITSCLEVQLQRNYAFQLTTWDNRQINLSALTSNIRANWLSAIRKAAGLPDPSPPDLSSPVDSVDSAVSAPRSSLLFSSDEEFTIRSAASEPPAVVGLSGRRCGGGSSGGGTGSVGGGGSGSGGGGGTQDSAEWGEALPPSPPLNRTPMSRVKERARGVSKWRGLANKRSRSSPPSSRRSTLDSVSSQQDLLVTAAAPGQVSSQTKTKEPVEESADYIVYREKPLTSSPDNIKEKKRSIAALERKVEDLLKKEEEIDRLRARDSAELEALKSRYSEEKEEWERAVVEAENSLDETSSRLSQTIEELSETSERARRLTAEVERLETRLAAAIEENEGLYSRLREVEGCGATPAATAAASASSPVASVRAARSVDSLSDLTSTIDLTLDLGSLDKERLMDEYRELRSRLEKAVVEIRALKRELRESEASADWLELSLLQARQESAGLKREAEASTSLMAARIQDLATKLSASEKQVRLLKQKLSKTESRDGKRRSLSLKGRESFSLCKELEEKLSELERKVCGLDQPAGAPPSAVPTATSQAPPAPAASSPTSAKVPSTTSRSSPPSSSAKEESRLRRQSLDSATSSEPLKVLLRLRNLEAKLTMAQEKPSDEKQIELKLFNGDSAAENADNLNPKEEMVNEVKKMENLLRAKLLVLAKKKESLIKAGQWTNEAKLNLLAEKLAYESVLIGRLHDAVMESKSLDLTDAERLITSLDDKINGAKPNMETSLDYLVKSLAKHLTQQGVKRVSRKPKERKKPDPVMTELLNKKTVIDAKVEDYINSVVDKLAEAFAVESLADDAGTNKNHLQAAWSMAQEAVNKELIQAEISQVLSQCSQTYHNLIENENETRFSGIVKERANLEMWATLADENLKNDMGIAVKKLEAEYMKRLEILKLENRVPIRPTIEDEERTRDLLNQFVDIVAHKSLLDARVTVLCNGEYSDIEPELGVFEENSILSEIQFLYVKFCRELSQDSREEERLKEAVERVAREVRGLSGLLLVHPAAGGGQAPGGGGQAPGGGGTASSSSPPPAPAPGDSWIETLTKKCEHLKEKLIILQKSLPQDNECSSCALLQEEILRLENHHASEIQELKKRQEEEVVKLREDFDEQKSALMEHYQSEEEKLRESYSRLERRLETWEAEYAQQTEDMKSAFSNISLPHDFGDEESMRRRYQAEVQHLKAVCEKGLDCMENAHRRQIQELQEKHERELQALRLEKEQALTEETHATLAALDAMRKAHEAEVQKEVAKFKAEYISQMQSSLDISALHKEHQAEMEEIKREILSLSDKYSIKCVESASLEDKLRIANQQLAHAHQHIMQLDARNRQLRAHLAAEASVDSLPSLQEHSHGVGRPPSSHPRVVNAILKKPVGIGNKPTNPKPSEVSRRLMEPPPLPKAEVKRSPELSLCGMVSKRREEFERRFTSACTDRPTLI